MPFMTFYIHVYGSTINVCVKSLSFLVWGYSAQQVTMALRTFKRLSFLVWEYSTQQVTMAFRTACAPVPTMLS